MNDNKVKGLIPISILSALAVFYYIFPFVDMIKELRTFSALPYTLFIFNTIIFVIFIPAAVMLFLPLISRKLSARTVILTVLFSSFAGFGVSLAGNAVLLKYISYYTSSEHYMKVWFFILNCLLERAAAITAICVAAVMTLMKKSGSFAASLAVYGLCADFSLHDMITYMVSYGSSLSSAKDEFVNLLMFSALIVYIACNYDPKRLYPNQALADLKRRYEKGKISEEKYNEQVQRINNLR